MRLVESNLSLLLTYQAPQLSRQCYCLGGCNTIWTATQVVIRSYRWWYCSEEFDQEFIAFSFDWNSKGLYVKLVEARFGDNWTEVLRFI